MADSRLVSLGHLAPAGRTDAAGIAAADAAARSAAVTVRLLHDVDDMQELVDLFVEVGRTGGRAPPVNRDLLRALEYAGSYVAVAEADGSVVGGSVGFYDAHGTLHSH